MGLFRESCLGSAIGRVGLPVAGRELVLLFESSSETMDLEMELEMGLEMELEMEMAENWR
mgnify:CR=1 FL=1